jgi:hypothetical protein
VKYWEIIADNLSKAGWESGCVSGVDSNGRTIFVADAHIRAALGAVLLVLGYLHGVIDAIALIMNFYNLRLILL